MKKRISFSVSVDKDLTARTIDYFKQTGFVQENTHNGILKFKRGSIALNLWTPNALRWKSTVLVNIVGHEIVVDFTLNSIGHLMSQRDKNLWDSFIGNYKRFLTESNFDIETENEKILKHTHRRFVDCFGFHFLIGLIIGILGGPAADLIGLNFFVLIAIACGAYLILTIIRNFIKGNLP